MFGIVSFELFMDFRILHLDGFSKIDMINYRYLVHSNVVVAVSQLLDGLKALQIPMEPCIKVSV